MADGPSIDVTEFLGKHLDSASPDLLREMVATFAQALMGAEADALCGAPLRRTDRGAHEQPQWLPGPGVGLVLGQGLGRP